MDTQNPNRKPTSFTLRGSLDKGYNQATSENLANVIDALEKDNVIDMSRVQKTHVDNVHFMCVLRLDGCKYDKIDCYVTALQLHICRRTHFDFPCDMIRRELDRRINASKMALITPSQK